MRRCYVVMILLSLALPAPAEEEATTKPVLVLEAGGHTGNIVDVMFTPDGKRLISAAMDSTVRIWDVATGESLQVVHLPVSDRDRAGPGEGSYAATLSADGRILAMAGWSPRRQHAIYLYDLAEKKVQHILQGHAEQIVDVAFSRDGKWLASCGNGRLLRVWDAADGTLKYKLPGHAGRVQAVAFSPDGRILASGDFVHTLRLWSMETGKPIGGPCKVSEGITSIAWSPDGKMIAVCGQKPIVHLLGPDGSSLGDIERTSPGEGLAFSEDGKRLLAGTSLLDVSAKKELKHLPLPYGRPRSAALSPDAKMAANGSVGPGLYLWRIRRPRQSIHQLGGRDRSVAEVFWSRDGQTLVWKQIRKKGEGERPELAFRLPELKFVRPAADDRQGAEEKRGQLSLKKIERHQLELKRGEETVRTIKTPGGLGGISEDCFTFVGDKYIAIGQTTGLFLYDVASGARVRTYQGSGALRSVAPAPGKTYFVAGGTDEVLRVYTTDREAPLLSLFVAGDDWIAWTPEGYYASSPGGERLMGWQVPGEAGQLPMFYAAAQFHKSLYRPDVIRLLLETGSVAKALERADKAKSKVPGALLDIEKVLPPQVSIVAPEPGNVTVSEAKLRVKAVGQSVGDHPVTSLQLLLDDRPYEGQRGLRAVPVPQMGKVEKEWTVQLTPGSHRISVLAKSDVSSTISSAIDVTYKPARAEAPAANDLRPSLYVLAIGINAYAGDMKLDFAVKDAADLVQAIDKRSKSLFREVKIELLTDKKATRQGILDKLDWLKKQMKPHDVAAIFYAGHGHRDDQGRFYLLSIDMKPDELDKTTVTGEELKKYLAELPGRVLLMMDACHSGAIGSRVKGGSITDDLARELADDDCGVIVMCAAMGNEESRESAADQHGYFTLALIEGLGGQADYNKDGLIQLTELDLYVDNRVSKLSKDEQHPVTAKPTTVRSFALAKY